ncbi:MAG: periplasmic heavy metal sensor [Desulfobacterium sp.]|jgi:zinc resistance-associated protein|nr:periplasmic heavy metal sensor [Desulfobacterium sp.]
MKKQIIIVTALVFALVGFSAAAFAWNHHGQGQGKRGCWSGSNGGTAPMTNLTEAQQTQLNELHQKFIDETADTRAAMHGKQEEMRILMQTSNPDQKRLISLTNETGDLKKALMEKRINLALEAKKIAPEINFPAFGRDGGRGEGKRGVMDCPRNGTGSMN